MRSRFHSAVVAAIALSMVACADVVAPTGPAVGAASTAAKPVGPPPIGPSINDLLPLFSVIVAGNDFTCARKNNGAVYCWGLDNLYQSGGVGNRTCSGLSCADQPRLVFSGATTFGGEESLSAGTNHTCVLSGLIGQSAASCWGDGNNGQLGFQNGMYTYRSPVSVAGGLQFSSIGAGATSTCGTTAQGLFCWGSINSQASQPLLFSSRTFARVGVANMHVCGFGESGGIAHCQGRNDYGSAGSPSTQSQVSFNDKAQFGTNVTHVSMEDDYTCFDRPAGDVQCVGINYWGQLGNGTTSTPEGAVSVGGGMALHGVTTGPLHACALDPKGAAWCWGNGNNGQVGGGTFGVFSSPQLVNTTVKFRALAAGIQHTCGIGTDNHIYCWGRNHFGNIGIHDPNNGWFPSPVQAIDPVP